MCLVYCRDVGDIAAGKMAKSRYMGAVREDMEVRAEDADDRVQWRRMTRCGDS